jgi:hypothetical protein
MRLALLVALAGTAACSGGEVYDGPDTDADQATNRSIRGSDGEAGDEVDGYPSAAKPGEPCPDAKQHSLRDLAALAETPVWLPDSEPASESTFTGAWNCGGGDTPVLTYGPITVSYEAGYRAPLDWERKAADSGGEVRTILGETGLLVPSSGPNIKGEVMVVVEDGILIRVLGEPDVPPEDLVTVADSIRLDQPVQP